MVMYSVTHRPVKRRSLDYRRVAAAFREMGYESARPPDPKYPYGYGKVAYFSAGFEGGMIALAAARMEPDCVCA